MRFVWVEREANREFIVQDTKTGEQFTAVYMGNPDKDGAVYDHYAVYHRGRLLDFYPSQRGAVTEAIEDWQSMQEFGVGVETNEN